MTDNPDIYVSTQAILFHILKAVVTRRRLLFECDTHTTHFISLCQGIFLRLCFNWCANAPVFMRKCVSLFIHIYDHIYFVCVYVCWGLKMGVGGLRRRWREGRLLGMRSVHQPRGFKYEARKGTKEETTLPPSLSTPSSDGLIKNIRGENNIGFLAPLHKNLTVSLTSLSHSSFFIVTRKGVDYNCDAKVPSLCVLSKKDYVSFFE